MEMWVKQVNARGGAQIVVADFDEDGRPDLLATAHGERPQLFRNVVPTAVRRPPRLADPPGPFRNQGYLSARDPRQFLGWGKAGESPGEDH